MAASLGMLRDESDAVEEQRVVAYPSSDLFTCRFLLLNGVPGRSRSLNVLPLTGFTLAMHAEQFVVVHRSNSAQPPISEVA